MYLLKQKVQPVKPCWSEYCLGLFPFIHFVDGWKVESGKLYRKSNAPLASKRASIFNAAYMFEWSRSEKLKHIISLRSRDLWHYISRYFKSLVHFQMLPFSGGFCFDVRPLLKEFTVPNYLYHNSNQCVCCMEVIILGLSVLTCESVKPLPQYEVLPFSAAESLLVSAGLSQSRKRLDRSPRWRCMSTWHSHQCLCRLPSPCRPSSLSVGLQGLQTHTNLGGRDAELGFLWY